ncbi:MAG: 16S rRNA processing protein RimM [Chitinophagaceae bacterium]|nr:16S rRNA processing protein RimM [Chitinophagaceae bacterium]
MQRIGKIVAAHGIKGDVLISHDVLPPLKLDQWDCMLIELNPGSFIPFFIESISETTETELLCKFEEIEHREATKTILNKTVYTSINYTIKTSHDEGFAQYLGYTIHQNNQNLGPINDILEGGAQLLFQLNHNNHEVLIPAIPEFILSTDPIKKIIYMQLPDGLLDL